jgi:excisionase family DNA binding protein
MENAESIIIQQISFNRLEESFRKIIREELTGIQSSTGSELKFYSREEACSLLKICKSTLDEYVRKGVIKGSRFGRRILFSDTDIQAAIRDIPTTKYKRR